MIELVVEYGIDAYARGAGLPDDVTSMTTGQEMQYLGVAIPLYLILYAARFTLWSLVAARVLGARGRDLLPVAILAGFILTMVYTAGVLLALVGFFVFLHWFLYVPAQLAKGERGIGAAFEASRAFAKERATYGFTALVVLIGAAIIVGAFVLGGASGAVGQVGPAIVEWLFGPIVPLLAASYVAVASSSSTPPPTSPPPSEKRATIKCPQCATLIPYTPTGSAVDVVCPSCGYAGRAL